MASRFIPFLSFFSFAACAESDALRNCRWSCFSEICDGDMRHRSTKWWLGSISTCVGTSCYMYCPWLDALYYKSAVQRTRNTQVSNHDRFNARKVEQKGMPISTHRVIFGNLLFMQWFRKRNNAVGAILTGVCRLEDRVIKERIKAESATRQMWLWSFSLTFTIQGQQGQRIKTQARSMTLHLPTQTF